ncbi:MAG TPA: DEAD/DEAH box helicase [Firmicutes bacterium]|nr:DEAD/DEAH box helicase [Bacillota bacterium]
MFKEFSLNPMLLRNLARLGYVTPTPVQAAAIPPALAGKDMIVTAETGSGKTAAFLLPVLESLLMEPAAVVRGLVLCPTREIALQVEKEARRLSRGTFLRSLVVYGGVGIGFQVAGLKDGTDLVVATPGRLLDHIWRGSFNPDGLRFLVIDEADRMLDMGFLPDLRRIVSCLPSERQTMLFSATMPPEIAEIASCLLREPERITVGDLATPPSTIEQQVYPVSQERKTEMLLHLLASARTEGVLVFARTKHRAERLARQLCRARINAACLHGDRSQPQREAALSGFRRGSIKVLVATDIAARGLDIRTVSHVVNYDLPNCPEAYVHRIGRTARAGASGTAWSMITPEDTQTLKAIERMVGHPLAQVTLPEFSQPLATSPLAVRVV